MLTVILSKLHFVNSLSSDQEISKIKRVSDNCAKTFSKPNICAKDGDDKARHDSIYRLVKLDGVKVGHVREMNLTKDRTHRVLTRSMRPLLFEIPEFLSRKECDQLIQLSQKQHLKHSETVYGRGRATERKEFEKKLSGRNLAAEKISFCRRMQRQDGKMPLQEFIAFIDHEKHIHPTSKDALPIFRLLDVDLDGFILLEECLNMTGAAYSEFLYHIEELKLNPRYYLRFSETAPLPRNDPLVRSLQGRFAKLTGLSRTLIEKSEPIQVVRYSVYGHYNVHYDTTYGSARRTECCRGTSYDDCHLCRFITIILYLNDVAKGGETAFPVADDAEKFHSRSYSITLNKRCQEANLIIKPKKGSAVMWYNHLLEYDGADHMAGVDSLSLHGGCDVTEGVKWIANVWLNAPLKSGGEI